MGSKDRGLTKAEKRWRRELAGKAAAREQLAKAAAAAGQTPEEYAAMQRFAKETQAEAASSGVRPDAFVNCEKMYGVKLSEALLHVCEPLIVSAEGDPDRIRKSIMLGIVGWNIAVDPRLDIRVLLRDVAKSFQGPESDALAWTMKLMFETIAGRKNELYPKIKLLIVKHEVVFTGTGLQVNVAGVLPEPDVAARTSPFGRLGRALTRSRR
jgi:hypothetical protein